MNFYHGFPLSGDDIQPVRFLRGNRKALVSFYNPKPVEVVAALSSSFVLDNGAFSHWNAGKGEIDFEEYARWVNEYCLLPNFDWCLIPDKIDGTEEENLDLVHKWVKRGYRAKGVPVWHLHESLGYLDYLVSNFEWVAFGSSGEWGTPNTPKWWQRMSKVMNIACDDKGRPRCKFHGLRMLDPDVFTRLPLASADSTNAGVNAGSLKRFGIYQAVSAGQRAEIIADRIESHCAAQIWTREDQQELF